MVLEAVKQRGYALVFASAELKADKEVVLEAVKQDGDALRCASPTLRDGGLKSHLAGLIAAYTVPLYTFLSILLVENTLSATTRFEDESGCAPWKLNELGEEGVLAIKKDIAAYAGVQCTGFVGVPWSIVIGAARNLGVAM